MRSPISVPNLKFLGVKNLQIWHLCPTTPLSGLFVICKMGYNRSHIRSMVQYGTKMIFGVLDVSLIVGLNIGETDNVFFLH